MITKTNEELEKIISDLQKAIDAKRDDDDRSVYAEVWDDFIVNSVNTAATGQQVGAIGLKYTMNGTTDVTQIASIVDHPGIIELETGAISGKYQTVHSGNTETTTSFMVDEADTFECIVRVPTITSIQVRAGIGTDLGDGSFGTDSVYFEFAPATSTYWQAITRSGSTSNAQATTVAVTAGNWYKLMFNKNDVGDWDFYVNDVLEITSSTDKPTGVAMSFGVLVWTLTGAARYLDLDFIFFKSTVLSTRYT